MNSLFQPYPSMAYPVYPTGASMLTPRETIPKELVLGKKESGFFFGGVWIGGETSSYVGMPQGKEGHVLIVGYTGKGKTSGLLIPTLQTWKGPIVATDIKGELSDAYAALYREGLVTRPWIVFDPSNEKTPSFDPWKALAGLDDSSCQRCIFDIAHVLLPDIPNDSQPFWIDSARSLVEAVLLDSYMCGLSFSDALVRLEEPVSKLYEELEEREDERINGALGEVRKLAKKQRASIDVEFRNKIHPLASDDHLMHSLRGERGVAKCFDWNDLEEYNIFLRIPETSIEAWSPIINLLYMQLFRHLEQRPEMHTLEGKNNSNVLICMDELAQFGRLPHLTHTLTTLRCRNVNFCLSVQSFAQLDKTYGELDRRIIADNCAYQVMLGTNDVETQKYFADLIGTRLVEMPSRSVNFDPYGNIYGYSCNLSTQREYFIQPHELAHLDDVVVHAPFGTVVLAKHKPGKPLFNNPLKHVTPQPLALPSPNGSAFQNETKMLTLEERKANAESLLEAYEAEKKLAQKKQQRDAQLTSLLKESLLEDPGDASLEELKEKFFDEVIADPSLCRILRDRKLRVESDAGVFEPLNDDM